MSVLVYNLLCPVVVRYTIQHAGAYELVMFNVKPGYIPQFEHRLLQGLPDRLEMDYPHPLGFWFSEFAQNSPLGIIIILLYIIILIIIIMTMTQ